MGRLGGMTAVVTGAARGLGRAVARRYAREGATLFLCDRIPIEDPALEVARRFEVDLRDREACASFVNDVLSEAGAVDVLVNNAAILAMSSYDEVTDAAWDETLAINLTAPFLLCRGFLPAMRKKGGSIINVSSRAGVLGFEKEAAYCASKFGIEGLTRALAADLKGAQVSINSITPGLRIKPTMMTDDEESAVPLSARAWQDADAIANAFVLLALARGNPTGKRFEADQLSEELQRQGWTA